MSSHLHHISIAVSDLKASTQFYDACLSALGYKVVYASNTFVGLGKEVGKDKFGLVKVSDEINLPQKGLHFAFSAKSKEEVDNFYRLGRENGGVDNGAPGFRPQYGEAYYAGFLIDPDGYHIEAVINKK